MIIATILIAIAVLIAAVLVFASTRPNKFEIVRSATINAPGERIIPLLNDPREHLKWSPFEKDPNAKRVYSGALQGKGSVYEWDGNREVGAGRVSILDVTPSRVLMDLQMTRPFKCHNQVEYTLTPAGGGTTVSWAMRGPQPLIAKVMSLFINCDKMVGSQFDQGLAKLKTLAEA
jgi:hypothetical protein